MGKASQTTAPAFATRLRSRIEKLLALAGSPNQHEAASAAAKAQDLLFRHQLRIEDLGVYSSPAQGDEIDEHEQGSYEGGLPIWRASLAEVVARTSLCEPLRARRRRFDRASGAWRERERVLFVGRPVDLELARLTLDFLTDTLLKLANTFDEEDYLLRRVEEERLRKRGLWSDQIAERLGKSADRRQSFLEGATATVRTRLEAAFAARQASPSAHALVVHRTAEIDAFIAARHARRSEPVLEHPGTVIDDAYELGQARAEEIRLHPELAELNAGG